MRVVVIGGGLCGSIISNILARNVKREDVEIYVVEKNELHYYQPSFTLISLGLEEPDKVYKKVKDLIDKRVNIIKDRALSIDAKNNKVILENGELKYDYLVIASGADYDFDYVEGLKEAYEKSQDVNTFYTYDGAIKLRDNLRKFQGGRVVISTIDTPYKCPGAPIKFANILHDYLERKGLRGSSEIIYVSHTEHVFAREPFASKIEEIFKEKGIKVVRNFIIDRVDYENRKIVSIDGQEIEYDLYVFVPPHKGFVSEVSDPAGFIPVDKYVLRHVSYKNIYACGDVAALPTSKSGSAAKRQAGILARNLLKVIEGSVGNEEKYDGYALCPILTRYGRAIFAEFNYEKSLSSASESWINWIIKVYLLKHIYFNFIVKGYLT